MRATDKALDRVMALTLGPSAKKASSVSLLGDVQWADVRAAFPDANMDVVIVQPSIIAKLTGSPSVYRVRPSADRTTLQIIYNDRYAIYCGQRLNTHP